MKIVLSVGDKAKTVDIAEKTQFAKGVASYLWSQAPKVKVQFGEPKENTKGSKQRCRKHVPWCTFEGKPQEPERSLGVSADQLCLVSTNDVGLACAREWGGCVAELVSEQGG